MTRPKRARKGPVVTLDGPAGAGKSTVARLVAQRLSLRFLDTGAMYRAYTWKALEESIDLRNARALVGLIRRSRLEFEDGRVRLDGRDITDEIRAERVTRAAAFLADPPEVRAELVRRQRELGRDGGLVAEGRDQGTVVFPSADHKFYLDASLEVRARRRQRELQQRGEPADYEEILRGIAERDDKDRSRPVGALRKPPGAIEIDTSDLTVEEVVEMICRQMRRKGSREARPRAPVRRRKPGPGAGKALRR